MAAFNSGTSVDILIPCRRPGRIVCRAACKSNDSSGLPSSVTGLAALATCKTPQRLRLDLPIRLSTFEAQQRLAEHAVPQEIHILLRP